MADLLRIKNTGLVSLEAAEIALIITALRIAQESAGLEGKSPVTVDGLRQDLIDVYMKVSGGPWIE